VQFIFDHHKSRSHPRALPGGHPLRGQPAADAGRVSGLSGAGDAKYRHRHRDGDDALGYATTAAHGRAARHEHPQHVLAALAHVAQAREPMLGPRQQLCRVRGGAAPGDEEEGCSLVALDDDRPLTALAGIWTEFKGDRGTNSKPIPRPHLVYGFLTTTPNAVVEPIHPKAMPVILTTDEERDVWMRAPCEGAATAIAG